MKALLGKFQKEEVYSVGSSYKECKTGDNMFRFYHRAASSFGHMGREPKVVTKTFESSIGEKKTVDVELFTWEKRDFVEVLKKEFFSN